MQRNIDDFQDFKEKCVDYCAAFDNKNFNELIDGHYEQFY